MSENGTNSSVGHPKTAHASSNPQHALAGHTSNVEILTKDAELLRKTEDLKALPADVRSRLAAVWDMKVPDMEDTRQHYHSFEVIQDTASPKDLKQFREDLLAHLQKRVGFEAKQVEIYQARLNQHPATQTSLQANTETGTTGQAAVNKNATKQSAGIAWHQQPLYAGALNSGMYAEKAQQQLRTNATNATSGSADFKPHVNANTDASVLYTDHHAQKSNAFSWHKKTELHAYENPIADSHLKKASKAFALGMGLMAVGEAAQATEGKPFAERLKVVGGELAIQVADALPGVTYVKKMAAGQYQEARLDAAGYMPLGIAASLPRSPEVQAIIDALPKNKVELAQMQQDRTKAPINRHLAEAQLAFIGAKENGEFFKGESASIRLTELAEHKLVLQAAWKHGAEYFASAVKNPNADWEKLIKDPEIGPHAAIHLTAVKNSYPPAFISQLDTTLTKNLASGTPISPQMMEITRNVQMTVTKQAEPAYEMH